MGLDKKSIAIIDVLKSNSRMSVRDIAKKTGLRPSTVHQRITKLKEEGVIEKFTIKVDNDAVEEGFIVYMLIKTKPNVTLEKVFSMPQVKEVFGVTGEYDIMVKMKFSDVNAFNDFILKFRKDQHIESTLTMVATASIKETI